MPRTVLRQELSQAHSEAAGALGRLALALAQGHISRSYLLALAASLRAAANRIERVLK